MIGTFGMEAYDAYKMYLAVKRHFTTDSYDFFKYNGAVRASAASFEKRRDKYFFTKLAKQKDLLNFLAANMAYGDPKTWVGDIVGDERAVANYRKFVKVRDSLAYTFEMDLEKLDDDIATNITVVDGQHPPLLRLALREEIHIETFIILNDFWRFVKTWKVEITDEVIWPEYLAKCKKFRSFMSYDREKMMQIALDRFRNTA